MSPEEPIDKFYPEDLLNSQEEPKDDTPWWEDDRGV
jgi:hypothetical protein